MEVAIVETILNNPEFTHLVDEIFFEYHVYMDGLQFGQGDLGGGKTVDHALKLLRDLREKGIRSHFWI